MLLSLVLTSVMLLWNKHIESLINKKNPFLFNELDTDKFLWIDYRSDSVSNVRSPSILLYVFVGKMPMLSLFLLPGEKSIYSRHSVIIYWFL